MNEDEKHHSDLHKEELDDEILQELVLEAQQEALLKDKLEESGVKPKHPLVKWILWLISIVMVINTFAVIFQIYSIPAIDFLITSAKLSQDEDIANFKKAVVVVLTDDSKGTGFSISSNGTILTNYHVVEGNEKVTVTFPDEGRFTATVAHTYPSVDLAVLETEEKGLPSLDLAKK